MDTHVSSAHDITQRGKGIMTGAQFLESLRDGRQVWFEGQKVEDVTTFEPFKGLCASLAHLYDLQHEAATQGDMTFVDENGVRCSAGYRVPDTKEALLHRRKNHEVWSRETFGLMGRNPDFCSAIVMGFYDVRDELAKINPMFKTNVENYLQYARTHDLCLSHGLHDPNMDKTFRPEQDPDRCLRIIEEREDGVIVRGLRYATLAPFSNECLVYPTYALNENENEFGIWFAIPMNAPGVKIVCRESYAKGRTETDDPIGVRFDEQDASVIFDDVFVPWSRVFLANDAGACRRLIGRAMTWVQMSAAVSVMARYELTVGVACLVAETGGIANRPRVKEELAELISYSEMQRLAFEACFDRPVQTPSGLWTSMPSMSRRIFDILISERVNTLLEHVGTGSLVFNQTQADLEVPELKKLLAIYGRGKDIDASTRQRLVRVAWQLAGGTFGSRQQLYERLHSGDPYVLMGRAYDMYNKSRAYNAVNRLLGTDFKPTAPMHGR